MGGGGSIDFMPVNKGTFTIASGQTVSNWIDVGMNTVVGIQFVEAVGQNVTIRADVGDDEPAASGGAGFLVGNELGTTLTIASPGATTYAGNLHNALAGCRWIRIVTAAGVSGAKTANLITRTLS